jgi:hypothetical protein
MMEALESRRPVSVSMRSKTFLKVRVSAPVPRPSSMSRVRPVCSRERSSSRLRFGCHFSVFPAISDHVRQQAADPTRARLCHPALDHGGKGAEPIG